MRTRHATVLLTLLPLLGAACGSGSKDKASSSSGTCPDPQGSLYMSSCDSDADCGPVMSCVSTCPSCSRSCKLLCGSQADCDAAGAGSCYGSSCTGCRKWCHGAPTVNPNCSAGGLGDTDTGDSDTYNATCPEGVPGCDPGNGCTSCDSSCGSYCQNLNGTTCGPEDCMDCPAGFTLEQIYSDGTGRCAAGSSSACSPGEYECLGSGSGASLKVCEDGAWQTDTCGSLCIGGGYDIATDCGYDSDKGHDLCYCDYASSGSLKGIGDPCSADSECASGDCSGGGWCTTTCSEHADCDGLYSGSNSTGNANSCLEDSSGGKWCFPDCYSDAECAPYPGTSCKPVSGDYWSVCSF